MLKHLTKHGNSWALIIDKPILELLKIDPTTPLELSTDGQSLLIVPVKAERQKAKVSEAHARVNQRYAKVFKKLGE